MPKSNVLFHGQTSFDLGLMPRKAAYVRSTAVPLKFTIDMDSCIKCDSAKARKRAVISRQSTSKADEAHDVKVGSIIVATGSICTS